MGCVVLKTCRYCVHVIVVDNGSSDATTQIAAFASVSVLPLDENLGKSCALNTGIQHLRDLQPDAIVLLDADGQHSPKELSQVVTPVILDKADIVIGSRDLEHNGDTPRHRVVGHWAFNTFTRWASSAFRGWWCF